MINQSLFILLWTRFLDLDSTSNLKEICVWLAKLKHDILHEYLEVSLSSMGVADTSDNGFCHPTLEAQIENFGPNVCCNLRFGSNPPGSVPLNRSFSTAAFSDSEMV